MSYNCLTDSCVLRRTIFVKSNLCKSRSYYPNNACDSFPKAKAHTAHLLIYYDAHLKLKHNHTIVAHITLTIQVIFVIID